MEIDFMITWSENLNQCSQFDLSTLCFVLSEFNLQMQLWN